MTPRTPPAEAGALPALFAHPERFPSLPVARKELLLRLARRAGLLASLRVALERAGLLDGEPERVRDLLEGAWIVAREHERSLRWEVDRVRRAFYGSGLPVIPLKGAAYALLDLPMAKGRLVADLDLLLPAADLPAAERLLAQHGWVTTKPDPYDQRYYREWMHELPPLRHRIRLTELDIHHAILPRTARLKPDSRLLLADAIPLPGMPGVWTPAPVDLVLHAATQLFHDHDFQQSALRDLLDLDALMRHWGESPGFWQRLPGRAVELDLARPLWYALFFLRRLCRTPVPEATLEAAARAGAPGWPVRRLMAALIPRAIPPLHPDRRKDGAAPDLARLLLYIRSHWLRMPPGRLFLHLTKKWLRKHHVAK